MIDDSLDTIEQDYAQDVPQSMDWEELREEQARTVAAHKRRCDRWFAKWMRSRLNLAAHDDDVSGYAKLAQMRKWPWLRGKPRIYVFAAIGFKDVVLYETQGGSLDTQGFSWKDRWNFCIKDARLSSEAHERFRLKNGAVNPMGSTPVIRSYKKKDMEENIDAMWEMRRGVERRGRLVFRRLSAMLNKDKN